MIVPTRLLTFQNIYQLPVHSSFPSPNTNSPIYYIFLFLILNTQTFWVSNFSSKSIYWVNLFFVVEPSFEYVSTYEFKYWIEPTFSTYPAYSNPLAC